MKPNWKQHGLAAGLTAALNGAMCAHADVTLESLLGEL
jgi:hypothetical protein